nr:MAG: putative capsid protein [Narnaviridae sp.]
MYSPVDHGIQYRSMNKSKQNGGKSSNNNNNNNNNNKSKKMKDGRITKVINRKEYAQIAAPVAYSQKQEFPNRERMTSRRIKNSEFISTIVGSTTFNATQKFVINPGLVSTFPWLSVLAAEWQQYRIHKLCFRYVTRTSTSSVGSVILSPDYNAVDQAPSSEQVASNTQDAVEDVCWRSITCHLDVQAMFPFGPRKQIRVGNISGDYTTYDAGRLFVCVTGQGSAAEIGKLWVDYDVELFVPQSSPGQLPVSSGASSLFTLSADQTPVANNTLTTIAFNSSIVNGLSISNSSGVFTPPAGNYLLDVIYCTAGTIVTPANNTIVMGIYKNGVLNSDIMDWALPLGAVAFKFQIPAIGYISVNGTDTVEIKITNNFATTSTIFTETRVLWDLV